MQEQIISKMIKKIKSLENRISHLETKSKEQSKSDPEIKFVSYTGKYPCLCYGVLTLQIDDKQYELKDILISGGSTNWRSSTNLRSSTVTTGKWEINEENLPDELKQHVDKIARIVNENVELGCCGGCM